MYIYIVIAGYFYEGKDIIRVLTSKAKALDRAKQLKSPSWRNYSYDFIFIEKWKKNGERIETINFYSRR